MDGRRGIRGERDEIDAVVVAPRPGDGREGRTGGVVGIRAVLGVNEFVVVVIVVAFDLTIGDVRRPVNGVCARGTFGVVGILS